MPGWLPLALHVALISLLVAFALHGVAAAVHATLRRGNRHPDELFTALVLPPMLGLLFGVVSAGIVCCHLRNAAADMARHPLHLTLSLAAALVLIRAAGLAVAHVWRARSLEAEVRLLGRPPGERMQALMRRIGVTVPLVELEGSVPSLSLGRLRPWIAISRRMLAQASESEVEAVLWHEASHAQGRDNLRGVACVFSVALLAGLPSARGLHRLWREACELRCDDAAVQRMRGGLPLAAALVKEVRLRQGAAEGLTGFAGTGVGARIRRLMDGGRPLPRRALATLLVLFLLATVVTFGALRSRDLIFSFACVRGPHTVAACSHAGDGGQSGCTCDAMPAGPVMAHATR